MTRIIKATRRGSAAEPEVLNLADFVRHLRQVTAEAGREVRQILDDARAQARALKREAAEEGHHEGFARGMEQGYTDGSHRGAGETRDRLENENRELADLARSILDSMRSARSEMLEPAADEVLELALELAGKIVGRLAADITVARANMAKALQLACPSGRITVRVNPGQLDRLTKHFKGFVEAMVLDGQVRMVADPDVTPGGVKLTTARGEIDATVETQLAKVAAALVHGGDCPDAGGTYVPQRRAPAKAQITQTEAAERSVRG